MTARTRLPLDPAVVGPWELGSGPRGALLIHGFTSTPPELRRLGEYLGARGWRVRAPALAGHASRPEDLARTSWQDWAASARWALDQLRAECDAVVVAGQSMGGTLALHLAATDPTIVAVATMAAPVWVAGVGLRLLPALKYVKHWYYPGPEIDLSDPGAVEELWSYGKRSTHAAHELSRLMRRARRDLPMVRQPVLLLHGGRDKSVDPRNAEDIERRLVCSAAVERHFLPRSGHSMSVDVERDRVNELVTGWFDRHLPLSSERTSPQPEKVPAGS